MAGFIVVVSVLVGCGGDSSGDAAGVAAPEGSVIEGPEPTPTPAPTAVPTAVPEPTVAPTSTPAPTATPEPTAASGPEAEIIEAWERYLRLSIEARGKTPSPEALDFDSYSWGDAQAAVVQEIADDNAAGHYIDGSTGQSGLQVELREDGVGVVALCIETDWVVRDRATDSVIESEGIIQYAARARVDPQPDGSWLVAATEFSVGC